MHETIPAQLFIKNRKKLSKKLGAKSLAVVQSNLAMHRNGDQDYPFRQNSDLFYLSGIAQANTLLFLFPGHPDESMQEILFVDLPDEHSERWEGKRLSLSEASGRSGVASVKANDELEATLRNALLYAENVYINLNEQPKYKPAVATGPEKLLAELQARFPARNYRSLAPWMRALRMVKEDEEVQLMQQAIGITAGTLRRVASELHPGMPERSIEALMHYEFIRQGAAGHAYAPIVAAGQNACVLHYTQNHDVCREGELLLMDFGAEYNHYAADLTRTLPVSGKFSDTQLRFYEEVLHVQQQAISLMKPGISLADLNKQVNEWVEESHIRLGLYTAKEAENARKDGKPLYKQYYMHGTAHHIGLDVHDFADNHATLEAGMVLTCEPGFYDNSQGIGIRIEDNILVADEPVNLTQDIPKSPEDIEELLA